MLHMLIDVCYQRKLTLPQTCHIAQHTTQCTHTHYRYVGYWRCQHNGTPFGHRIWTDIIVRAGSARTIASAAAEESAFGVDSASDNEEEWSIVRRRAEPVSDSDHVSDGTTTDATTATDATAATIAAAAEDAVNDGVTATVEGVDEGVDNCSTSTSSSGTSVAGYTFAPLPDESTAVMQLLAKERATLAHKGFACNMLAQAALEQSFLVTSFDGTPSLLSMTAEDSAVTMADVEGSLASVSAYYTAERYPEEHAELRLLSELGALPLSTLRESDVAAVTALIKETKQQYKGAAVLTAVLDAAAATAAVSGEQGSWADAAALQACKLQRTARWCREYAALAQMGFTDEEQLLVKFEEFIKVPGGPGMDLLLNDILNNV
jgi:hypothetical protein